jgi:hypothetical protein
MLEETKKKLNSGNVCHHSIQNILPFYSLSVYILLIWKELYHQVQASKFVATLSMR